MLANQLVDLRKALGYTQTEMATAIGMGLRNYQNLEAGTTDIKRTIELAVSHVSLERSVELKDPMVAPQSVRKAALDFTRMVTG